VVKGLLMVSVGLWIGIIGQDPVAGIPRFTMGNSKLLAGIDFLPVAMGLFGIAEILQAAGQSYKPVTVTRVRLRDLYPNKEEIKRSVKPCIRGSLIGFLVGLLPGPAPTISTFVSYSLEKRFSKNPGEFGQGAVEGVVGPESANNAAVTGSMIPLLALGIPFAPPAAVMLASLLMHNVQPGPLLIQQAPQIFWGVIASMYIGNVMLLLLNLPLVGLFARIATLRMALLMPVVIIICLVGVYSVRNSVFDIWIMVGTGIVGYMAIKWGFPVAPLVIGLVLGPMTENSFRQSFMMFRGQVHFFLGRPIAMALVIVTIGYIFYLYYSRDKVKKAVG
jgi:putative tricarboxylic transport membrane protein